MSWVSNLFNTGQAPQLAPSSEHRPALFSDVQEIYKDGGGTTLREGRRRVYTQPMDEEEEAARAPYWHV